MTFVQNNYVDPPVVRASLGGIVRVERPSVGIARDGKSLFLGAKIGQVMKHVHRARGRQLPVTGPLCRIGIARVGMPLNPETSIREIRL